MNIRKGYIEWFIQLVISQYSEYVIAFFQSIIIARALGPDKLGMIYFANGTIAFLAGILSFRTQDAVSKFYETSNVNYDQSFITKINILIDLMPKLIIPMIIPFILKFYKLKYSEYIFLFIFYFFIFILNSIYPTWYSYLRYLRNYKKILYLSVVVRFTSFFILLLLYFLNKIDIFSYLMIIGISTLLQFLIQLRDLKEILTINNNKFNWSVLRNEIKKHKYKDYFSFIKATYISTIFTSIYKNIDIILLGKFADTAQIGIYSIAKKIAEVIRMMGQVLADVIFPDFAKKSRDYGYRWMLTQSIKISKILLLPCIALYIVLYLSIDKLIVLIYGKNFVEASQYILILSISSFIMIEFFWGDTILNILSKYYHSLLIKVIVSVSLSIILYITISINPLIITSLIMSLMWALTAIMLCAYAYRETNIIMKLSIYDNN